MEWSNAEHTGSYRSCPNENRAQLADSQSASAFSSALSPILLTLNPEYPDLAIRPGFTKSGSYRGTRVKELAQTLRGPDHCGAVGEEPVM